MTSLAFGSLLWFLATCTRFASSLRARAILAATERTTLKGWGLDDAETTDNPVIGDVAKRMQYWSATQPGVPPTHPSSYLLFDRDIGGLNNIRIGWEAAGLAAALSGRTLVLPPPSPWYILDSAGSTSRVEDFINLAQLKHGLPTLTFEEFLKVEREELDRRKMPSYQGVDGGSDFYSQWVNFAHNGGLDMIQGDVCTTDNYQDAKKRLLYVPADKDHRIFGCSVWWEMGQPKFTEQGQPLAVPSWGYKFLKDSFVWNPRFINMAAPVVQSLGIFKYVAIHARFGDFQYAESRQPFDGVAKAVQLIEKEANGQSSAPALLQTHATRTVRARWRGEVLAHRVASLIPKGSLVYIATDDRSPALLEAFTKRGIKAFRWDEVLEQGRLAVAFAAADGNDALLKKWSGPIEQLICAYSRVFIGTDKSTFSGYIRRLRTYNGAPQWRTQLSHTMALSAGQEESLWKELSEWDGKTAEFDADSIPGVFPPGALVNS